MADSFKSRQQAQHERIERLGDAFDRGCLIGDQPVHMTPPFTDDKTVDDWYKQKWPVKVFKQSGE